MSMKGLDKITDKILDEARAEVARILGEATDEAEKIIEEVTAEKTVEEPVYTAPAPKVEEKKPVSEEKTEVKKRGFFSRIFGRK